MSPSTGAARAVVFVDYQNMYRGAREAFGYDAHPGHFGNFRPISFGRVLTREEGCVLVQVRVYTGIPVPQRDRKGNAIMQRRIASWVSDSPDKVEVFPRPLRYPPSQGREKGVDVELAIDIVRLALDDVYDIAIVASADTDLVPALEFVVRRCPDKLVETVAWEPEPGREAMAAAPIDVPGGGVRRRTIPKRDFERIAERRNFAQPAGDPTAALDPSRWARIRRRFDR